MAGKSPAEREHAYWEYERANLSAAGAIVQPSAALARVT
jgi:hypothetical protein